MSTLAVAAFLPARHSRDSRDPFHAGLSLRGYTGSQSLGPAMAWDLTNAATIDAAALNRKDTEKSAAAVRALRGGLCSWRRA
jgi:hypothetical protein